jgi:sporulation protein YlmC with PRC-barrel domain
MLKHTLTAAALTAALAIPAFAQQPPANPDGNAQPIQVQSVPGQTAGDRERFVQTQHATDWRSSKLIGATVYGPDNASIGNVNDVLFDNNGKLRAVVIGVGGFLGVGEKDVAVPFETLNVVRKPESSSIDKVTVSYTKDDLKNAPKFAWYEPGHSATTGSGTSDKIKSLNPMSDQKK